MAPVKITAIPVGPEAQAALAGKTVTAYDGMSRGDLFKLLTYGLDGAIVQGHTTTKIEDAAGAWLNRIRGCLGADHSTSKSANTRMVVATAMRDPAKIAPSSELELPSRTLCLVNGELHSMVGRSRWSGADDDTPFSASRDS